MHAFGRPRRHTALDLDILLIHLLRVLQRKLEPPNPRSKQTGKLGLCEARSDTAPGPVEKREEGVVAGRPAARRRLLVPVVLGHPAIRVEAVRVGPPEAVVKVGGPGDEHDARAAADGVAEDRGVVCCLAEGERDGAVVAKDFAADGVEVRHAVNVEAGDVSIRIHRWQPLADFFS